MGTAWDIIPPRPRPQKSKPAKGLRKSNKTTMFFVMIIIIMAVVFIYLANQNTPASIDGVATTSPQKPTLWASGSVKPTISTAPMLKSQDNLLIKVHNGGGRSEETNEVSQILVNLGYKVTKTENALNLYDQTIVYFEAHQKKYAEEIAGNLSKFQAKIQQFSQNSPYDLIIVIGAR